MLRSEQSSGAAATDGLWNIVKDTSMSDSTWHSTIASEAPKHEAQGTALPPVPEQDTIPVELDHKQGTVVPKRNHNRNAMSGKPKEPMTVEQKQQAITMAAAGHSCNKISQAIGKDRVAIKRHLDTPEAIEQVRDERTELVELYREKARDCVAAIDDEKIAKASALQLATSSGILLDKSLLLSGKPTQNVAVLIEVLDVLSIRQDEEIERQWQEAHARLLAENKP